MNEEISNKIRRFDDTITDRVETIGNTLKRIIETSVDNEIENKVEKIGKEIKKKQELGLKDRILEEYSDLNNYIHILTRKNLTLEQYSQERFGNLISFNGLKGYVEKEGYWVNEGLTYISILFNETKKEYLYYVVEPELSTFELLVLETLFENILDTLTLYDTSNQEKDKILENKTLELLDCYSIDIDIVATYKILYYIKRDYIGYERLDALMKDPNIEDISCDGSNIPVFVYHRKYQNIKTNLSFEADKLDSFVMKLAQSCQKQISLGEPLINSTLPEGSRLNASLGKEITFRGSTFTIRKFREHAFTPADLIKSGTFSSEILAFLWLAVENGKSILFAGATAAGKTSALNAISLFIPSMAKIISIEDTHELVLHHLNWIGSVTRESVNKMTAAKEIDMYELLRQALRQRPEYIIVGEIRGKEAMTLFQAMNTGHTTFSTMHADSINTVISRLEGDPINVPRVMIRALDLLCIQTLIQMENKKYDSKVRRLDTMIEFTGIDEQTHDLRFNEIYTLDTKNDCFKPSGRSYILDGIMVKHGWDEKKLKFELDNRRKLLEYMVKKDMAEMEIVSLIQNHYVDPQNTMRRIEKDV
ncbi:MAG: type II/IV secretion system ATPase subunit [Candidatus Methanoperedens sp.]|nr:type II/IV secretion system ATPase subunit [Candidatus Methanoperedens sp.]